MGEYKLPKNFDEFIDARKEGFMIVKDFKEKGGKIVGTLCSYCPVEVMDAAGAAAIGLCGFGAEVIPDAEQNLPKNLCPLIKSTYGFAFTEKCPYTYFADLIVGETTCDGKKKMYELLDDIKPTYVLHLPQGKDRSYAKNAWYEEVKLLKEKLEEIFGITITDEALRKAANTRNRWRKAMCRLFELQAMNPPAVTGGEILLSLQQGMYSFDVETQINAMNNAADRLKAAYEVGERPVDPKAKRILLTGCPTGGVIQKVCSVIEQSGGAIVCNDNCGGEYATKILVDEDMDDILRAISDRYLKLHCSVMTPNDDRIENTKELIKKYKIEGVVEVVLHACHTYNIESDKMRRMSEDEMGVPYMKIETDYSMSDSGQLATRINAFIEML